MSGQACSWESHHRELVSRSVGTGQTRSRNETSSRRAALRSAECETGKARCTHQHPPIAPSLRRRLLPLFQPNQRGRGSFVEAASKQRLGRSERSISRATHIKLRCSHRLLPRSTAPVVSGRTGRTWMDEAVPSRKASTPSRSCPSLRWSLNRDLSHPTCLQVPHCTLPRRSVRFDCPPFFIGLAGGMPTACRSSRSIADARNQANRAPKSIPSRTRRVREERGE